MMTTTHYRRLVLAFLVLACSFPVRAETLTAGANIGNVPWEFADARGQFAGFEIDLVREVGRRLGAEVEIVNIPFNGLFSAVQSGRIDVALSSITITPKRLQSVAFVQPYYDSAQSLTVHARSRATGLEDMADKIIGVDTGSTGDMWTTANQGRYAFGEIRRYEGLAPAMLDLQSLRIDAYISDIPSLQYYARDKSHIRVIQRIETGERYSMMLAKSSPWLERIDAVISALKEEGYLASLHAEWFGVPPEEGSATTTVLARPQSRD